MPSLAAARSSFDRYPIVLGSVSLFLLLVVAYSFSVPLRATRNASITADEPFYLLTTQSLLQDGNLDLRAQYARESYREFFDHPSGLWQQSLPLANGKILSPHEPGTSYLVLPGFAAFSLRGAQWTMLLVAALTFVATYILVAKETKAPLVSWLVTAAVALSATAFVYSTEIYPEVPGALCIVLSLLVLRSGRRDAWAGVVLMILLTLLAWFGIKYVFLGALIGLHFVVQAKWQARAWFAGLSAVSGVIYVAAHLMIFDHLVPYSINTVYEGASSVSVLEQHLSIGDRFYRLWGLFVDQRFGIGRWAPIFLILLPSLPLAVAKGRVGFTVTGLILTQLLIATFLAITMMGFWFSGRTMMTVLPLFALPLTYLALKLPVLGRAGMGLLALTSLVTTFELYRGVHDGPYRLAFDPFNMQGWIFRHTADLYPDFRFWNEDTWVRSTVWLLLFIAGVAWSARSEFHISRRSALAALTSPRRTLRMAVTRIRQKAAAS